ncbi:MAG: FadR family transcriptional regulator [Rhodobacteraceae bacterium]|nr:MAG: FadR family transcriptional regulator [Paracoccaceae bacterium]
MTIGSSIGSRAALPRVSPECSALALEQLRVIVTSPDVAPGARLPTERDLSAQLGIGRRAIRRALEVLEAEGLIWRKRGAGTFAGPPQAVLPQAQGASSASPAGLLNLIEARLTLEPQLARLAALRAAPEVLPRIATCIDRIAKAEDVDSADLWDNALHREIAQATGNPLLLALFDRMNAWRHDQGLRKLRAQVRSTSGTGHAQDDHRRILAALQTGDAAAAARAMHDHLAALHSVYLTYCQEEARAHDV